MRCNKARQEIIWERHHGAGSVVPFSLQAGNDIFFRFYLTKAECLALTWDDFEEFVRSAEQNEGGAEQSKKGMRLSISKTILQDGTPKDTTKNKKNRKIPLSPEVVGLYTENYEIRAEERSDRIFTCTYNTYIWYLTMVCRKTGIPHCSCHSFRHTFISNLIRKGVPLPVIEKVSGDTQKTIFERYSHMFEDDEGLVLRALENL